jgi:hypothetical protein
MVAGIEKYDLAVQYPLQVHASPTGHIFLQPGLPANLQPAAVRLDISR